MAEPIAYYRRLDSEKIIETVRAVQNRVEKRFPGSGLSKVVAELLLVAQETVTRTKWIQEPNLVLRCAAIGLSFGIILLIIFVLAHIHQMGFDNYVNFIQALDASLGSVVFIGAAIIFLVSWENRIKRERALKAIHELRAMAHIVDMHQLTKDPESYFVPGGPANVKRSMTSFEMNRYLDYCSEMLALISKIAALYVQGFQDPVLLDAVDDMEDLTAGFSRKIWQKITILENMGRALHGAVKFEIQSPNPDTIPRS